jgi:hypothetical protein
MVVLMVPVVAKKVKKYAKVLSRGALLASVCNEYVAEGAFP